MKKPMDLAVAYSVQKKASKKKMAKGGMVNESATSEHRPMPDERDKDSQMVSRNSGKKPPVQDQWTDQPTVAQAQRPSRTPLSRPKMANGILKVRDRADVDKEEMMMTELAPSGYGDQPDREYDEVGPSRQGPDTPSLHMKKMANGGVVSMEEAEQDGVQHPAGLEEDNDQMRPPEDEYMANHFAEGGMAEEEMDHEDSIAAAIMAKDRMEYAEGGYIDGEDSIYSDDSDQADLSRNAEEDKNLEDQASFDILRKENYSESDGLRQLSQPEDSNMHGHDLPDEDSHDMVDRIRSKMNRQRQFKVR